MAMSIAATVATPPTASLSFFACSRSALGRSSIALPKAAPIPRSSSLLSTSFLSAPSSFLSSSSFFGLPLGIDLGCNRIVEERYRRLQVRAAAKPYLVKRSRSGKSLARTHGFRRRMRTTGGRAVLRRRRAKGRYYLCTKSHPSSGP